MTEEYRTHTETQACTAKRISWGAIIAGVILVLIIHVTLAVIGIAVGLSTVDPATERDPAAGLATGAMIWWIATALIALFIGGWATARLSPAWTRTNGMLHGLVMWAVVQLIFIYLLTSAIGGLIGGAFGIIQSSLSAAPKIIPRLTNVGTAGDDIQWQQIENDVKEVLRQTGKPQLSPEQLEEEAQQAGQTAEEAAAQAAQDPQQAYETIMQTLDKLLRQAKGVVSEVDRQAAVNVLVERTDMSRQQARRTVDRWIGMYQEASQQIEQTAEQVKETAAETAEEAVDAGTLAAWWSAGMLLVGALCAAIGGTMGIPAAVRKRNYTVIQPQR